MYKYIIAVVLLGAALIAFIMKPNTSREEVIADIPENASVATFAGGCFWCIEATFEQYDGIYKAVSGYIGGSEETAKYELVSSGQTDHFEAVQVYFDTEKITYDDLLQIFWRQIDPTDNGGSFVDRGSQYRSAIFYHSDEQKAAAEQSRDELASSGRFDAEFVTEILPYSPFYLAEKYHQDYHITNKTRYKLYRAGSGRDQFRDEVWGDDKNYQVN